MGEQLLWDIETDGLLADCTKLHSIQLGTVEGTDVTVYCDALPGYPSIVEGLHRLEAADMTYGHNVINFDVPALAKLQSWVSLDPSKVRDTLIMSRLADPEERKHSLRDWGTRLGVSKGDFEGPWDTCTQVMMEYAAQDICVTRALLRKVKHVEGWGESCGLEHAVAWAISLQERNGFQLDVAKAAELEGELRQQIADLAVGLRDVFPARWVPVSMTPFVPKGDNKRMGYVKGAALTKVNLEVYNPASRQQTASRLQALGWKPTAFGKDGCAKVDEQVLASLPYPEAQRLVEFYGALKLLGQVSDGDSGWLKLVRPTGRIHGRVNTNGAVTGRMSHHAPNAAQISKDPRARQCWIARPGWKLVDTDFDALEARMLAHYLARYDDGAFTKVLLEGRKDNRTEVHSANLRAMIDEGLCPESGWNEHFDACRGRVKNLLYGLMYGAGNTKLGLMARLLCEETGQKLPGNPASLGKRVRVGLSKSMKGLDKLTTDVSKAAERGWIRGLDGRHVPVRSPHSALNTLLQSAGAITAKQALRMLMDKIGDRHGDVWAQVLNCHDQITSEVRPDFVAAYSTSIETAFREAGEHFNLRCPISGTAQVGDNLYDVH